MTIQKLSSGSKKNCRFFCVCRDLAGFVGQNVLKDKRRGYENKAATPEQDDQPDTLTETFISMHLVTYCNISLVCYTRI